VNPHSPRVIAVVAKLLVLIFSHYSLLFLKMLDTYIENLRNASTQQEELVAARTLHETLKRCVRASQNRDAAVVLESEALDVLVEAARLPDRIQPYYHMVISSMTNMMMLLREEAWEMKTPDPASSKPSRRLPIS